MLDLIIRKAIEDGATDIHVELEEKELRTRYRIDGWLVQGSFLSKELRSIVTICVKIMAGLNISNTRSP